MTDELADGVQPEETEGQGEVSTPDAPYKEYLNRIPEEVRGEVEPVFREWDANTTKRFQEASEYKRSWEPYEQVGVNQHDPNVVQWGLRFAQLAQSDPQAIQQWFQSYAQQHGLQAAQEAAAEFEQEYADPSQQLEQMMQQRVAPLEQHLARINAYFQQQDEATRLHQAQAHVESQLKELETKHGDEFNREWVGRLVSNHLDQPEQAVALAWQDFQAMRNQLEKQTLQQKVDAPDPAEGGGLPDVNPDRITTFEQAKAIALQTLRNNNST